MEEEFLRRNTDCVYFLASPLTCKKGIECEYRHSDIARINPKECWYWLGGSCLNPTCAFRHPPLDGRAETAPGTAVTLHQPVAPVKKTNVPCYFYYNSFCNKGHSCSFLHGPADSKPSWKFSKTVSSVVDSSLEKKTSMGGDLGPAPVEANEIKIGPEIATPEKITPEKDPHKSTYSNIVEQSASPRISDSPYEEAVVMRPNSLIYSESQRMSHSTDHSTENQVEHIGQEVWWESSPGFDVLVNDGYEELEYDDDADYLKELDEECQDHNHQNLSFEYEDNVEYDPAYPDMRISFQQGMREFYDYVDDEDVCNPINDFQVRERVVDSSLRPKRKSLPAQLTYIGRSDMDLRDYLRKRRVVGVHYPTFSDYRGRGTVESGRLHGRLASKVEKYSIRSEIVPKTHFDDASLVTRTRRLRPSRSRPHYKNRRPVKRQRVLSEISGKKPSRKHRSYAQESTMFTRPKTLAEIKEEKKKAV